VFQSRYWDYDTIAKAEQIGWHLILSHHLRKDISTNQRLAIVVDSELQMHREINGRRTRHIAEGQMSWTCV
jgi:hypothetical protein